MKAVCSLLFKMTSTSTTCFITNEDAVNYVMADNCSDIENVVSESGSSDSSGSFLIGFYLLHLNLA